MPGDIVIPRSGSDYRRRLQDARRRLGRRESGERLSQGREQTARGNEWDNSVQDAAAIVRDFVKWNDTAASAALRVALRSRHRAGADAEDLLWLQLPALVVPGNDESHATTAARYLFECLPLAQYWDAAVESQTESTMPETLLTFLAANEIKGSTR